MRRARFYKSLKQERSHSSQRNQAGILARKLSGKESVGNNFDNTETFCSLETGLILHAMQAGSDTRYTYIAKLQSQFVKLF